MSVPGLKEMESATLADRRVVLLDEAAEWRWSREALSGLSIRCEPEDWRAASAWIAANRAAPELRECCARWAARRLGCDADALLEVSAPLRARFAARLRHASATTHDDSSPACTQLCIGVLGWEPEPALDPMEAWPALAELAPADFLPRLVVDARSGLALGIDCADVVARGGAEVALRVEPDQWRQFVESGDWSRAATRWRMAPVLGPQRTRLAEEIPSEGSKRFVQMAAPAARSLLDRAAALIVVDKASAADAVSGEARSAAEALLHAVLESRPLTRHRFSMNAALDFPFGLRAAEGDVVATDARLVVELDGYYHFRDSEAYRRDRRKDAALQEHGWFVLRFLAEDIVCDLESVVARIESHLARRDLARRISTSTQHPSSSGTPDFP